MAEYGKLLKMNEINGFTVSLCLFDDLGRTSSYSHIMQENYKSGYTQVIINSYLMLKIVEDMLRDGWTLLSIFIDDPSVDEETKKEVNSLVEGIKKNPLNFNKLSEYLEWALEDGSIFIDKIMLASKFKNSYKTCELYSNGVLFGDAKQLVFSDYIKNIVEDYLNEG
ncbi:hypothetical protein [Alkalihalobacterium chitinilyticum]|uniref:Uncharacterized protein n=1 Tax=Alkalihalobacterium chitinilyticum TaxID=2980103 RepID=A0ABT5VGI5_9BACI|nr:hypothetical protein [Alkalihalobacterium chitinilyticum]MDE5414574.1 hypothetical protein [Alkalihalobacterium chitinilyticum]